MVQVRGNVDEQSSNQLYIYSTPCNILHSLSRNQIGDKSIQNVLTETQEVY